MAILANQKQEIAMWDFPLWANYITNVYTVCCYGLEKPNNIVHMYVSVLYECVTQSHECFVCVELSV